MKDGAEVSLLQHTRTTQVIMGYLQVLGIAVFALTCWNQCAAQNETVICKLQPVRGPCRGAFPMWYYDFQGQICRSFTYGGCRGNNNRFETQAECRKQCREVCPKNQHYEECGTACQITCDNHKNPPSVCGQQCAEGCHCDEGYVRAKDGQCIKPSLCPSTTTKRSTITRSPVTCPKNEQYTKCAPLCPATCNSPRNNLRHCSRPCKPGCQCNPGLMRTRDNRCVKPANCPRNTGPFSIFGLQWRI